MEEITHLVADFPLDPLNNKESSYPFIEQIFTILDHNKDICIALLGKNGDMAFVNRIEKLIADTVLHRLSSIVCRKTTVILSMRMRFV